jgi:general stress protein 26
MRKHRLQQRGVVVTLIAIMTSAGHGVAEDTVREFPADVNAELARGKEISVATQRSDGSRSSAVPVWFAVVDNAIWFSTSPTSTKAKRIAAGSPMFVSVHGDKGPFIRTNAEIVKDAAMADRLGEIYAKKYWMAWLGLFRPSGQRVEEGQIVLIKLTP